MNYEDMTKCFISSMINGKEKGIREMISDNVICKVDNICGHGKDDAVLMGEMLAKYSSSAEKLDIQMDFAEFKNNDIDVVYIMGSYEVTATIGKTKAKIDVQLDISFVDGLIIRFNLISLSAWKKKHFVKTKEGRLKAIYEEDIECLCADRHEVKYYCSDGNVYTTDVRKTLSEIEEALSNTKFFKVGRSSLVNLTKIVEISEVAKEIIMPNSSVLIPEHKYPEIKKYIKNWVSLSASWIEIL